MINPQLGIDTWEGQQEIDEAVLKANDVKFMFIRLNSISGGHHKDDLFDQQWAEAAKFHRAPYFVYNPWVTGQQNFDWLAANMPPEAIAVAADLEVKKDGYAPATYAREVDTFITLCMQKWNYITYTGEWFLPYLSYWRTDVPYWWAQYPSVFYTPGSPQRMTWDELREKLKPYDYPFNKSKIPGPLFCWQISGDTLILPGNPRIMDLCIFYGDLDAFFGPVESQPPPDGGSMKQNVSGVAKPGAGYTLRVRSGPGTSYSIIGALSHNEAFVGWLENGWIEITYEGQVGYIMASWTEYTVTEPTEPPAGELHPFDVGVMVVREGYRDGYSTVHMEPK